MFDFSPLQNYILIEPFLSNKNDSELGEWAENFTYVLPEDIIKHEPFKVYKVVKVSEFCRNVYCYNKGDLLIVHTSLVEKINFDNIDYYIVPENGVIGKFKLQER